MSLLLDALRKAQDTRDRSRGIEPAERVEEQPQRTTPLRAQRTQPPRAPEKPSVSPLFALGLAVALFVGAVSAWHLQPWQAPPKTKIDASELKLDYRLDLTRTGGAAR